jgi:hypothetical protein
MIFSSLTGPADPFGGQILFKATRLLMFGLLSLSAVNSALAADVYPKAYDATYEIKSGRGITAMHMLSNGKGQTRTETGVAGGPKTVSIIDYPGKTMWTIIEASKMVMKGPVKNKPVTTMDEAEAKKMNATDLGSKMVNGHMSQGWSYKNAQGSTEVWIDKEAGVAVKSTSTNNGTTSEMNIKTLSSNAPPDSNFKIPNTGYKIIAMP